MVARRLQRGDLGGAGRAPGGARRPGRRRDHARGARCRSGDAQPPHRAARDARRRSRPGATPSSCTRSTRASTLLPVACPRLVPLIEGDDPVRRGDDGRRARVRGAAEGGRRRHGDPRLHALPDHPPDPPARVRPRRDAGLLRRRDRARGRRDARAQGRSRTTPTREGDVPLPHDGRPGGLPRDRRALPAAADRARSSTSSCSSWSASHEGRPPARRAARAVGSSSTTSSSRTARCCGRRGRRRCSARRRSRRACRAGLRDKGRGWLTAEYSLLPASTGERVAARGVARASRAAARSRSSG